MLRSYLDHAATSPISEAVLSSYIDALRVVGNPASTHGHGQAANALLEQARFEVANHFNCDMPEVVFTSGGTESINIAIKGSYWAATKKNPLKNVLLLPALEHHATLEAAEWLVANEGAEINWIEVNGDGSVEASKVLEAIQEIGADRVALVTLLWANNEVGSITDVKSVCSVADKYQIPVHIDAVAALGQVDIDFADVGAAMMSVSAHKIGGPSGVGALIVARSVKSEALFHGGSQQRFRAGSQDVAGAVAFASALKNISHDADATRKMQSKRDRLIEGVLELVPEAVLRGSSHIELGKRLPGNAHFTFAGCQGDSLLFLLDAKGVSVSVGSACQAGVQEISHVLLGMGIEPQEAIGSLRMTLAHSTSDDEIDHFLVNIAEAVRDAKRAGITSIDMKLGETF